MLFVIVQTQQVESPDRFVYDLTVQLVGHDMLKSLGVEITPTSAPDCFTVDTATAVLVRQVTGCYFLEGQPQRNS